MTIRYALRMTQLVARIPDDLVAEVDRLVERGVVRSRSEAVRLGLRALLDGERRASIGKGIVEGYERIPPDPELDRWAEAAGRALIEAEPW
jgi:Arc/MetJ-type ribon-helix-helix transcriptional regulator